MRGWPDTALATIKSYVGARYLPVYWSRSVFVEKYGMVP